jgi:hypothetical protein
VFEILGRRGSPSQPGVRAYGVEQRPAARRAADGLANRLRVVGRDGHSGGGGEHLLRRAARAEARRMRSRLAWPAVDPGYRVLRKRMIRGDEADRHAPRRWIDRVSESTVSPLRSACRAKRSR